MTRKNKGNYRAKHSSDVRVDEKVAEAVRKKATGGKISCAGASKVARSLGVSMKEIGTAVDVMEMHIIECQLGLFGYSPEKVIVKPAKIVAAGLEKAIRETLVDGRLPCVSAWEIADRLDIPRMDVSSACEALQIKVKPCQLGAF
jgi:hypothetical protein